MQPIIVESPTDLIVPTVSDQTFTCAAEGVPRPALSWVIQDGNVSTVIDVNVFTQYSISYQDYDDRTAISMLYITNVSPFQVADYVCVATNLVGETTAQARLTVYSKCILHCCNVHALYAMILWLFCMCSCT